MNIKEERKQGHISESKEKQRKSTAYQNTSVLEVETNHNNNNLNNSLISKTTWKLKILPKQQVLVKIICEKNIKYTLVI